MSGLEPESCEFESHHPDLITFYMDGAEVGSSNGLENRGVALVAGQ